MVIRGVAIEMCSPADVGRYQVTATQGEEQILVWLDAAEGAELVVGEPDENASGATEGNALFF